MDAAWFPDALRERWWVPSADQLDAISPGRAEVKVLAVELEEDGGVDLWSGHPVWVGVEEREAEGFVGVITHSTLDRNGFRQGDRLSAPLSRIFDWVVFDEREAPRLNEERARFAIGKRVLVGLTTLSSSGELVEQRQFAGELVAADPDRGLALELGDGSHSWLPPDVRFLEEAAPGEYRLRSTSEVVRNPDYLGTWTITRGEASHAEPEREATALEGPTDPGSASPIG
jgi:hypothetical protein